MRWNTKQIVITICLEIILLICLGLGLGAVWVQHTSQSSHLGGSAALVGGFAVAQLIVVMIADLTE